MGAGLNVASPLSWCGLSGAQPHEEARPLEPETLLAPLSHRNCRGFRSGFQGCQEWGRAGVGRGIAETSTRVFYYLPPCLILFLPVNSSSAFQNHLKLPRESSLTVHSLPNLSEASPPP